MGSDPPERLPWRPEDWCAMDAAPSEGAGRTDDLLSTQSQWLRVSGAGGGRIGPRGLEWRLIGRIAVEVRRAYLTMIN